MLKPDAPIRGRGATANPPNRFEPIAYERDPDWDEPEDPRPRTQFFVDQTKSALTKNDSPDVDYDVGLNPYRGCEHGCVYCYARPYHEYLGWSAGLDFETKIMVKEDAPDLLRKELMSRRWIPQLVGMSGVTDCYQPVERRLKITRRCLEVFAEFRNPVGIVTKNALVTRDIDVLQELARYDCVSVNLSVTTLDQDLNRIMEPRTSLPRQRLEAIRTLADAGIPVGVMMAPVIPGLTDEEIPRVLEAARDAGATTAGYIMLKLPHAVAPLFEDWLEHHYPNRKDRVLNRMRGMRGGKLYDSTFGERMRGTGFHANQVQQLFEVSVRKFGLNERDEILSTDHFRRPDPNGQLPLFE